MRILCGCIALSLLTACTVRISIDQGGVRGGARERGNVAAGAVGTAAGGASGAKVPDHGAGEGTGAVALLPSEPLLIPVRIGNWRFDPPEVRVRRGQEVSLELIGVSGTHGYAVPGLGINAAIEAGRTMIVDLPMDEAGTYPVINSLPVGTGGLAMSGAIVIEY